MKILFLTLSLTLFISTMAQSQIEIPLYPLGATESNGIEKAETSRDAEFIIDISNPRMYYHPAPKEKSTGTAVLICPGGGYGGIAQIKEGSEIAAWFNDLGVAAFVLYYRMPNGHPAIPLKDAQTALAIIKARAKQWGINKNKVGVMGFSAGGHLAATVGTHFKTKKERPAFMILAYPVISMQPNITHGGSRQSLLGPNPSADLNDLYSNELQVTKKTPPTFLLHARDDGGVPMANSVNFERALIEKNVSCELHLFDKGGHGFGMRKQNLPADNWPNLLKNWLSKQALIAE